MASKAETCSYVSLNVHIIKLCYTITYQLYNILYTASTQQLQYSDIQWLYHCTEVVVYWRYIIYCTIVIAQRDGLCQIYISYHLINYYPNIRFNQSPFDSCKLAHKNTYSEDKRYTLNLKRIHRMNQDSNPRSLLVLYCTGCLALFRSNHTQ